MQHLYNRALLSLLFFIIPLSVTNAWLFDRGLEQVLIKMKHLFQDKKLDLLYAEYVDVRLKIKIGKVIDKMRTERIQGRRIAARLGFGKYQDYLKASHTEIVSKFFGLMTNPPKRKITIKNANYLRLALLLSLIFAHFDQKMIILDKEIDGSAAKVHYSGNNFKMTAYFIYKNNRWYLTSEYKSGKGF